jgi:hypothetical protein
VKKNPNILWITALALGWLLDFLFWKKPAGINFSIFTLLCLIAGFWVLWADQQRPARGTLWLLPLILFFAAVTFVRAEPMTVFLGVVLTLFLLAVLAMTFLGGRWIHYTLTDYAAGFLKLIGSMIGRPLSFNSEVHRQQAVGGARPGRSIWPFIRGLVLALPVLALFAGLLASADAIFGQQLDAFIRLFKLENLPEYILRLFLILCSAYLLAGVFLHAASQSRDEKLAGESQAFEPFLGFTESAIVLGSVTILFAAFVIVQFRYFFGGHANINIEGFTYSEYARRGFGELVAVAFFSLLLILGLSNITRRGADRQRRVFSGLSTGIVALVLVMLVSAYQRLVLYELAYGFSRLRTYTHVFLIWIGLLLVAVVAMEFLHREREFATAAMLAGLGFAVSLSLLNVDAFIVRQNVEHEIQAQEAEAGSPGRGSGLDTQYFLDLSEDSIPALAQGYQSPTVSDSVREQLGAALACIRARRESRILPWQSFHLARFRADRVLESLGSGLDEYHIVQKNGLPDAIAPSGTEYPCYSYRID